GSILPRGSTRDASGTVMMVTATKMPGEVDTTPAPELLQFDHLEWWVGNARHAAQFFASGFGFDVLAYARPETGRRDRPSYVVGQGELRFVLTSPLTPDSEVAAQVVVHGDGVRDVAYRVADVEEAYRRAVARGGTSVAPPTRAADAGGEFGTATIAAYG